MARIVAGLCTSHVPLLGRIIDSDRTGEPYWQPIFKGYEPTKKWLGEVKPDVMIVVYNDHANGFTFQYTPTFAIGCADEFHPADEGWGPRPVPVVKGDPEFAAHIAEEVILDDLLREPFDAAARSVLVLLNATRLSLIFCRLKTGQIEALTAKVHRQICAVHKVIKVFNVAVQT